MLTPAIIDGNTLVSSYEVPVLCNHLNPAASTEALPTSSLGDLVALGNFLGNCLESSGSNVDGCLRLDPFLVIATQPLWHHVRYRTISRRGILLKLSDFLCYIGVMAPASALFDSLIFVSPYIVQPSFDSQNEARIFGCDFSISHSLCLSFFGPEKSIICQFLSIFSTFPEAISVSLMVYP